MHSARGFSSRLISALVQRDPFGFEELKNIGKKTISIIYLNKSFRTRIIPSRFNSPATQRIQLTSSKVLPIYESSTKTGNYQHIHWLIFLTRDRLSPFFNMEGITGFFHLLNMKATPRSSTQSWAAHLKDLHLKSIKEQGSKVENELSPATQFHLFPKLPPELRQMIYYACIPRRIFKLHYYGWEEDAPEAWFLKKPAALPLIAFVSKEALYISKLHLKEFEMIFCDYPNSHSSNFKLQTTPIRFNLKLDRLYICHDSAALNHREDHLKDLHNGPFALTMKPKVNLILEMRGLVYDRHHRRLLGPRLPWRMSNHGYDILAQQSHCTIVLGRTMFLAKEPEIRESGLFGLFGEERTVLVDIHDTAKIDQFEAYIRQIQNKAPRLNAQGRSSFFPQWDQNARPEGWSCLGAGRYGSCGATVFDQERTNGTELAPTPPSVHSVAGKHSVAEQDAASARYLIQQAWLEANKCFEPARKPLVPYTGSKWHREWDSENHVVKHWLSKLPTLSFVVIYQVTEKEKTALEHTPRPS